MPNTLRSLLLISAILVASVLQANAAPLTPVPDPVTVIGLILLLLAGVGSIALVWWPRN